MVPNNDRRIITEIVCILLALLGTAALLAVRGKNHRVFAAEPAVQIVNAPHQAFPLWYDLKLRGRILVLFDRHLNADKEEPDINTFREAEFPTAASRALFCSSLKNDGILKQERPCSVESLNLLLQGRYLYKRLNTVRRLRKVSRELEVLIKSSQGYSSSFKNLPLEQKRKLLRRNRELLEAAYPKTCPKNQEYGLTASNYSYLAIKSGIVRKIFHVIPEASWQEVEKNLSDLPFAKRTDTGFRLLIFEGTPVTILRLRDLPALTEPVLANINTDIWSPREQEEIASLFVRKSLTSDLTTLCGETPDALARRIHAPSP